MKRQRTIKPDLARFERLVMEYNRDADTLSEKEKALREAEITACAPAEKRVNNGPNQGDWLEPYLKHTQKYLFTFRLMLLARGDAVNPLWEALDAGISTNMARQVLSHVNAQITKADPGIPLAQHADLFAKAIKERWDGKPAKQQRPRKGRRGSSKSPPRPRTEARNIRDSIREGFISLLTRIEAEAHPQTAAKLRHLVADTTEPWLRVFLRSLVSESSAIPSQCVEAQVHYMLGSLTDLIDEWQRDIKMLDRTYASLPITLKGLGTDVRRACEVFETRAPRSAHQPVDLLAVKTVFRRKVAEIHPDKHSDETAEVRAELTTRLSELNRLFGVLKEHNERITAVHSVNGT